jgi:hypothetical protein
MRILLSGHRASTGLAVVWDINVCFCVQFTQDQVRAIRRSWFAFREWSRHHCTSRAYILCLYTVQCDMVHDITAVVGSALWHGTNMTGPVEIHHSRVWFEINEACKHILEFCILDWWFQRLGGRNSSILDRDPGSSNSSTALNMTRLWSLKQVAALVQLAQRTDFHAEY